MKAASVAIGLAVLLTATAQAEPVAFEEVSLMVRGGDKEPAIMDEVKRRKLLRKLTLEQEAILKNQGAVPSMIEALRDPANIISEAQAVAIMARHEAKLQAQAAQSKPASDSKLPLNEILSGPNDESAQYRILTVQFGQPVNLSQWGGPNYDIAFYVRKNVGEEQVVAVLTDNMRVFTDTHIHAGGFVGSGASIHQSSRSPQQFFFVNTRNPTIVPGVPFNLYPVYEAGGVSVFYANVSTERGNSVRVAVRTARN